MRAFIEKFRIVVFFFILTVGLTACGDSITMVEVPADYVVVSDTGTVVIPVMYGNRGWGLGVRTTVIGTWDPPQSHFAYSVDKPTVAKVTFDTFSRWEEWTGRAKSVNFEQSLSVRALTDGVVTLRVWNSLDPKQVITYIMEFRM
jgi:hypothetical protein